MDHGRAVAAMQAAAAKPFLTAAREDPRRTADPVQLAPFVAPLENAVDTRSSVFAHRDDSYPKPT